MMNKDIDFLGIKVAALNRDKIVGKIIEFALEGKHRMITYVNAHCVNISFRDSEYRGILNKMDLVYAGGMGVVWASGLFKKALPERVNILDFFDKLAERLRANKIRIYLLGAEEEVVQKAKDKLVKGFSLEIVGTHSGFFDEKEKISIVKEINMLKPNILMVGMGVPRQEKWIHQYFNKLDVNLCWAVGGVFKVLSGDLKKTPRWISDCGLEWLYLGLQDPNRLWKRYLSGNLLFIYHLLKCRVKKI